MKVKFANEVFEVLYTKEVGGLTMYAVEDEPNHIDWLVNVEVIDADKKELKKMITPIFNIHDVIIKKHNSDINEFGCFIITDIAGDKYWYNDRIICNISEQNEWELYEPNRQKPAEWSVEDERRLKSSIADLKDYIELNKYSDGDFTQANIDWLKSLKNRVQPKIEWTIKDEEILNVFWDAVKDKSLREWLLTHTKYNYSIPIEWSEEDEKMRYEILAYLKVREENGDYRANIMHNWLKSLRPQKHWKPSEEQMSALYQEVVSKIQEEKYKSQYDVLIEELFEQLEKL